MWAVLTNKQERPSFKSAPKVAFTLYNGIVGSLELAQKVKIVKNFEKQNLETLHERNLSNKFIKIH